MPYLVSFLKIYFLLEYNCFTVLSLVSAVRQHESAVSIIYNSSFLSLFPPTPHSTPLGCRRVLG